MFSAMQPTGELHLGNYLGALANWVDLARVHEGLFCIVDQHGQTVAYEPAVMREKIREFVINYLAAGIDPERSTVFVQSDVPEHTELAWYLATVTQFGELTRMTQFKDKSAQHEENINAGLFTYPVLMAADILLYKATMVPVGEDQVQHLELARDVAHRFNTRFGDTFPLPKARLSQGARIMGVDGLRKMSKSLGNQIGLLETDDGLWAKLRGAYTDPQRQRRADPGRPEICNIYGIHKVVTPIEETQKLGVQCRTAAIGCGDCKKALLVHLSDRITPIRERAASLRAHPDLVDRILEDGARRARAIARATIEEVREKMGLRARARGLGP
jgi:tryptophanyl-tRNA synthetase